MGLMFRELTQRAWMNVQEVKSLFFPDTYCSCKQWLEDDFQVAYFEQDKLPQVCLERWNFDDH
jgi:hypothetical protein